MRLPTFSGIILFVVLFSSCKPANVVFEEHQQLSADLQWNKSDARNFSITITDNSKPYEFDLAFRYATGFQYRNMMVRINETDPEGKVVIRDLDFAVRDAEGKPIGDAGYDIIDLTTSIDKAKKFPVLGTYSYRIEHMMPADTVHFAMEIGLVLKDPSNR